MGKLILKNNGIETQLINGVDFSTLTPQADTYYIGVDLVNGAFQKFDPNGDTIDYDSNSGGGGGVIEVTYSELTSKISLSELVPGTFYLITDFQTCYDQPDFDSSFNPIVGSNYKQGPIEPLIVLALSDVEVSNQAFSPLYPNDSIKYDWTWDTTEMTSNPAFGRITERIDENGNRTDYDHRNILFKRYLESTGSTTYNVIYDNGLGYIEVPTFSGTSTNNFIGDYTDYSSFILSNIVFGVDCNNNKIGANPYNNTIGDNSNGNVIGNFFIGNTIGSDFVSNEIGNYCGNNASFSGTPVQNIFGNNFKYNKIGDYFGNDLNFPTEGVGSGGDGGNVVGFNFQNNVIGNNTIMNLIGSNFTGNKIGDYFSLNSFGGDSQDNQIGNYFIGNGGINGYPNQMGDNFTSNKIGNYMTYNQIDEFRYNKIGDLFGNSNTNEGNIIYLAYNNNIGERFGYVYGNTIYFNFYDNLIGNNFNNNTIGDFSRRGSFYRNDIGNDFRDNIAYSQFQNNEIGNQFNNNICGGEFLKNTIGNGFNYNKLSYFEGNKIGNGANNNVINYDFNTNTIGDYFGNNRITGGKNNKIGVSANSNRFGSGFGFYDFSDITSRNYDTFRVSLSYNVGYYIIGRELIMQDTVNNEYYKVVFTKWTQSGNGGGFKYIRQKVYPSVESEVEFERLDYSADTIDIIVPGVLEIKRDDNGGGIYNVAVEGSFNSGVSPANTQWNSNFTSTNTGSGFNNNEIDISWQSNVIIGNNFEYNKIGTNFSSNQINGDNFRFNIISNNFYSNSNIGDDFSNNVINSNFNNNTLNNSITNNTFNNPVANNTISYQFTNNTIMGGFDSNNINFSFSYNKVFGSFFSNTIGYQCSQNVFQEQFSSNSSIGNNFRLNTFKSTVNGLNFSTATHVYGLYNCEIFTNSNNNLRLSYYDGSNALTIINDITT